MNAQHFINKLSNIPDERWVVGKFHEGEASCAMGHCGAKQHLNETEESKELNKLLWFGLYACVSDINDGKDKRFKQATPKERILAALESLEK